MDLELRTSAARGVPAEAINGNDAYPWDSFDPEQYVQDNYVEMHADDTQILEMVRDHFASNPIPGREAGFGVDVGPGANLYPTLTMLPFCEKVSLYERSGPNREWLLNQQEHYDAFWDEYWGYLSKNEIYGHVEPHEALKRKVHVRYGNIFQMPQRRWNIGTMFFVAESISDLKREFHSATRRFIGSLKPGAPFAAAFMRESRGYTVGKIRYPAVSITQADVQRILGPLVEEVHVTPVCSDKPLRPGYKGMILALGKAGRKS